MLKIDPLVSLAFAMRENPGGYALLLGSGVSRTAGIPTGWEIVLDLAGKLAVLHGASPENPEAWYLNEFGQEPRYDDILQQLGKTASERSRLLRHYFEPSSEEAEAHNKVPQPAHQAIADLARKGYVRLILTTNFDTLIETALRDAGVEPDVISTEDALAGARPVVHSKCMVVKLHGDYRDSRIRNTSEELAAYDKATQGFLRRVLDEFGLVVCGWSAQYDVALRNALLKCPSRRYTTYWTRYQGQLDERAERLVKQRDAVVIDIEDANRFFRGLTAKVEALETLQSPHPLSVEAAVASAKNLIARKERGQLEELVLDEVERVRTRVTGPELAPGRQPGQTDDGIWLAHLKRYESAMHTLCHLLATIAWLDPGEHADLVTMAIEKLAVAPSQSGLYSLVSLQLYPPLLAMYAAGVASTGTLGSRRFRHLHAVLVAPQRRDPEKRGPVVSYATPIEVLGDQAKMLFENGQHVFTPQSNYVHDVLRDILRRYLVSDAEFDRAFDVFEFMLGMVRAHFREHNSWYPMGAFIWRRSTSEDIAELVREVGRLGRSSALLESGLLGGDTGEFESCLEAHQYLISAWQRESHGFMGRHWPDLLRIYRDAAGKSQ